ncbi:nitroreductase family protein [Actinomadura madurae]|uniref:nitroreductase family protein n=1 Tax=Actinomadura madurae TaxID=1993 RepID=UPI0027E24155|nr:nitroreductase family protein [Actinomadura madurae]
MSEVPGAGRLRAARHDEGMTTLPLSPDELLTTTRTVRKRLDLERPVPMELVRECLEVALQAPSGSNRQGWQWVVVTDARQARGDRRVLPALVQRVRPGRGIRRRPLQGRSRARRGAAPRRGQRGLPRRAHG